LYADVFFLGCNGIHPESGVSNINMPEAQMKRRMMKAARRTVVLADGGKVGAISTARVAPIEDVDLLVTGPSVPDVALRELIEIGLSVHVATPDLGDGVRLQKIEGGVDQ
jgi:DeoR family transcriptional regulator of aga operon